MTVVIATSLEARVAAGRLAMARRVSGMTVNEVILFVMTAKESLWYSQAGQWLETPPDFMGPNTRDLYLHAMRFVRGTVDADFDGKVWWNTNEFLSVDGYKHDTAVLREYIVLSDVVTRLALIRTRTPIVISTGFETFAEIILGKDWPRAFAGLCGHLMTHFDDLKAFKEALIDGSPALMDLLQVELDKANQTEFPCINEFCTNGDDGGRKLVNITKRKSGACCRDCMNYECTHQKCVARAEKEGWPRYTHRWGTKIATEHKEWRKSDD